MSGGRHGPGSAATVHPMTTTAPRTGIATAIAIVAVAAGAIAIGIATPDTTPDPITPDPVATTATTCPDPLVITDATTDATIDVATAHGWIGDPGDGVEAMYAPGCIPGIDHVTIATAADGTITRNYVRPDGTVYGNVTGPDGDVVAVFGI